MKRIRAEQLQTTTLLYLKKRNFTDSEASFRHNFRFSSSPLETASNLIKKNLISRSDVVAMMTQCLDEYFLAFKALQEFVASVISTYPSSSLKKILCPVFLHSYLDLIVAGRTQEAEEFYGLFFDENFTDTSDNLLNQLHEIKDETSLSKYPVINKFRNKVCKIDLNCSDKEILLRFLNGQENLIVMKIINERLCFGNSDKAVTENISAEELLTAKKAFMEKKRRISELQVQESVIPNTQVSDHSPAMNVHSADESIVSSRFPHYFPPDKVSLNVTVDEVSLKNQLKWVRLSQPTVQGLNLYKFNDAACAMTNATLSNNKLYISSSREDSAVMLWNVGSYFDQASSSEEVLVGDNKISDVSLVTYGNESTTEVHERISNLKRKKLESFNRHHVTLLQAHSGPVYSSAFTHDDKFLLTCSEDTTVRLWDIEKLNNRSIYNGHNYPVMSLAVSSLSLYFASGSMDSTARLWSLERTFPIRIFAGHEHSVEAVSFHSNASLLASSDHTIRLWDVNSGKTVRLMLGHWAPVTTLAFSPDGKLLASAGDDCRIRIWDLGSGNMVKEIRSHNDTIYSVSFSPDSSLLASCGADSTVSVWNVSLTSASNSESSRKIGANQHLSAQWNLNDTVRKVFFSQFSGDLLNCIGLF